MAACRPPDRLWRQHKRGGCRGGAGGSAASPDGHRSALRGRLRPELARRAWGSAPVTSRKARCPTMIAPTGGRPMPCLPDVAAMSGPGRPIVNNSRPGQLVYDPFLGSGTSLIAAEMTGRTCIGLEISPAYVDVILRRWQHFTGRTAIHQASGQSFTERAADQDRAPSPAADA